MLVVLGHFDDSRFHRKKCLCLSSAVALNDLFSKEIHINYYLIYTTSLKSSNVEPMTSKPDTTTRNSFLLGFSDSVDTPGSGTV